MKKTYSVPQTICITIETTDFIATSTGKYSVTMEFEWAKTHTHLFRFDLSHLPEAIAQLQGKPVYFTIDLDVMDPSVFPGTGTPEYGGVSFEELRKAAMAGCGLNIVGCDIVELSPHLDQSGASTAAALKLMREMLLKLEEPYIKKSELI